MKWFRHFTDCCVTILWNIIQTERWYANLEGLFLCHLKIIIWYINIPLEFVSVLALLSSLEQYADVVFLIQRTDVCLPLSHHWTLRQFDVFFPYPAHVLLSAELSRSVIHRHWIFEVPLVYFYAPFFTNKQKNKPSRYWNLHLCSEMSPGYYGLKLGCSWMHELNSFFPVILHS
jgi:hypothetical protein